MMRSWLVCAVLAWTACYSPYEPACGFICGPGGACPPDFTCASDNVCHRNGSPADEVCPSVSEFDVVGATAPAAATVVVTFSDVPDQVQAQDPANYQIPGLTITAATLTDATVSLATSPQNAAAYTLTVSAITRASDMQPLTTATATFTGTP